jgi:hypothetical protein
MPLCRPAAVAVHDHGNVFGQTVEIQLARQLVFDRTGRYDRKDVIKRHVGCFVL